MASLLFPRLRGPNSFIFFPHTLSKSASSRTALLLVVAALLLLGTRPSAAQVAPVQVIRNDLGGSIAARLDIIAQFRRSGSRIEIRGVCASACTMLLALPNTCVARTARLQFHGPSSQYYGIALPPSEFDYWSRVMADHYPAAIKQWFLTKARYTTIGAITITGAEASRLGARPCT